MCIIILSKGIKPSLDILESAELSNSDGGGFAYYDNNKRLWYYKKGLSAKEIYNYIRPRSIKPPYIIHFRIATSGGTSPLLTHPFVIEDGIPLAMEGYANKLLFHNGVVSNWKQLLMQYIMTNNVYPFTDNLISDTRVIALLINKYGKNILDLIEGKFVYVEGSKVYTYGDFQEYQGLYVSNLSLAVGHHKYILPKDDYVYDKYFTKYHNKSLFNKYMEQDNER